MVSCSGRLQRRRQIHMLVSALRLSLELTSGSAAMACCRAVGRCHIEHLIRRAANCQLGCKTVQLPTPCSNQLQCALLLRLVSQTVKPLLLRVHAAGVGTRRTLALLRREELQPETVIWQIKKTVGWPLGQVTVR